MGTVRTLGRGGLSSLGLVMLLTQIGACSSDEPGTKAPASTGAGSFSSYPAVSGTGAAGRPGGFAGTAAPGGNVPVGSTAGRTGTGFPGTGTAGTGSTIVGAAGTGVGPGAIAGSGALGAAGSGVNMTPVASGGTTPILPEIKGECPEFKDGSTIMVAGHGGVAISAGAPGKNGPLLFYWHGTGSSAAEANTSLPAGVRSDILSSGGIIASFNGRQSSGAAGDCSGTGAHNMADFDAADQIAACAVKNHGIDPRRIYTTGCSAGGLQSGCMAQQRSSYIAAAAPNSGGVVFPQKWQDASSPAIFTMHGGPNDMVVVTFSETSATLDTNAKGHGSFVVNCNHGGGHCLAPAPLKTAAWEFMKAHPFGTKPSPWAGAIPPTVPEYCEIL